MHLVTLLYGNSLYEIVDAYEDGHITLCDVIELLIDGELAPLTSDNALVADERYLDRCASARLRQLIAEKELNDVEVRLDLEEIRRIAEHRRLELERVRSQHALEKESDRAQLEYLLNCPEAEGAPGSVMGWELE